MSGEPLDPQLDATYAMICESLNLIAFCRDSAAYTRDFCGRLRDRCGVVRDGPDDGPCAARCLAIAAEPDGMVPELYARCIKIT